MSPTVVFAGGGTGGHLMPAIAAIEALRDICAGVSITFLATGRDIESKCLAGTGVRADTIPSHGWNKSILGKVNFVANLPLAARRVHRIYSAVKPDVVVGLGGYASVMPVLIAKTLGIPVMLFESNAIPGKVTRLLSAFADEIQVQFKSSIEKLYRRKAIVTGNPIRKRIFMGDRRRALESLRLLPDRRTLLVMGGSQGAVPVNRCVCQSVRLLRSFDDAFQVLHLAGPAGCDETLAAYSGCPVHLRVLEYLDAIEDAYAVADLAVCRAGGSSLAELTAVGVPSILVPYPFAADRHQHYNALELVRTGASWLLQQSFLTPDVLAHSIYSILFNDQVLADMKRAALSTGRRDAAHVVAARILALAGVKTVGSGVEGRSGSSNSLAA